jgi:hypothetical protein
MMLAFFEWKCDSSVCLFVSNLARRLRAVPAVGRAFPRSAGGDADLSSSLDNILTSFLRMSAVFTGDFGASSLEISAVLEVFASSSFTACPSA